MEGCLSKSVCGGVSLENICGGMCMKEALMEKCLWKSVCGGVSHSGMSVEECL